MICIHCQSEVDDSAVKCRYCSEYLIGDTCQECLATIPKNARVCRFCGNRVKRPSSDSNRNISLDLKAEVFPTVVFRFRFLPHEIIADNEKIVIKTPGLFRLWENADEIPWNKVAGFNYRNGIIWDRVVIETRGQRPSVIIGLGKEHGGKIRDILQNLEK